MLNKLFKSKDSNPRQVEPVVAVVASAPVASTDTHERRRFVREMPVVEVVESSSESAWAEFQRVANPLDDAADAVTVQQQDFDTTLSVDTVPSQDSVHEAQLTQVEFSSSYGDVLQEIASDQESRSRKQNKSDGGHR